MMGQFLAHLFFLKYSRQLLARVVPEYIHPAKQQGFNNRFFRFSLFPTERYI